MVCVGVMPFDVEPVTDPIPLSIVSVVAPETFQDSADVCPAVMLAGFAVNDVMAGTAPVDPPPTNCHVKFAVAPPVAS